MAGIFRVLRGRPDGTFLRPEVVKGTDGLPLIIDAKENVERICTRPFAVDWNHDGVLDLVVGNFAGTFHLFVGKEPGKFLPKSQPILVNGKKPLKLSQMHSDPFFIDWDGDGDLDLLSGSAAGGAYWSENWAGPGKPIALSAFRELIPPTQRNSPVLEWPTDDEPKGPATNTRIWVDDVNGDGKLDILLGDTVHLRLPSVSTEEGRKRLETWQEEYNDLLRRWQEASKKQDREAMAELSKKIRKMTYTKPGGTRAESTGFVWLYLQK